MPINKSNQKGSVLVYALTIVGVLMAINFSLIAIFLPKTRIARQSANTISAIFSADSALEWCVFEARKNDITPPVMLNGATYRVDQIGTGVAYNSDGTGNSDVCPLDNPLDHLARGNFSGVTRSFEISEAISP